MRRVGDQRAGAIEDRAGKIQPFLNVDALRGVLQHRAGLLGDVHEQVVEQFQQHRIGAFGASGNAGVALGGAAQQHVIQPADLRRPAGFDHGGGIGFPYEGRAGDPIASG